MALLLPRIYVYKITFLEVPHYYYGSHLEKKYNEYYMGSPVTNKDFWEFYTPMKEYIEFFENSDEGYIEAHKYENNLIKPVYNTDPFCLNEHCSGVVSLKILREASKKGGKTCYDLGVGIFNLPKEQKVEIARKGGKVAGPRNYENGVGIHKMTSEQKSEAGRKGGTRTYERGAGIHNRSMEEMQEHGRKSGIKTYELGIGLNSLMLKDGNAQKLAILLMLEHSLVTKKPEASTHQTESA